MEMYDAPVPAVAGAVWEPLTDAEFASAVESFEDKMLTAMLKNTNREIHAIRVARDFVVAA